MVVFDPLQKRRGRLGPNRCRRRHQADHRQQQDQISHAPSRFYSCHLRLAIEVMAAAKGQFLGCHAWAARIQRLAIARSTTAGLPLRNCRSSRPVRVTTSWGEAAARAETVAIPACINKAASDGASSRWQTRVAMPRRRLKLRALARPRRDSWLSWWSLRLNNAPQLAIPAASRTCCSSRKLWGKSSSGAELLIEQPSSRRQTNLQPRRTLRRLTA